ncbi:5'-nucleotidase C-terminal domain-containing protein [Psittacicella gerlachiana]|uniref:5'-nucleotidase n=1 Tax=Psittacicella gerlachiana TaxID=2028574 RepID=A0A3A1Y8B6_9GAMM|nr:5'-nucleotidase C-terminal domain-containing protein [Psittacicella gerlachiana]RIY32357.1 hypothetical protein CKF59_07055 [Psittacicella gerlachiana]
MATKFLLKAVLTATALGLALTGLTSCKPETAQTTPASQTQEAAQQKPTRYIVLHVNDTHGRFWEDNRGQGGFAYIKTIVDNVRKEAAAKGEPVVVLHAGDFNTGVPESDLQFAEPDIRGMNLIGFDAVVVGNHEFDVTEDKMKLQKDWLQAPLLSANIDYVGADGKPVPFYQPYAYFNKDGLSFLVVGTTTPSTKVQSNPVHTKNFNFTDPAQAFLAAQQDAEAKNGKADVVISLSHLGYYPNGNHGVQPYGDYVLAQKLPQDSVALFVSGHTHVIACVDDQGELVNYKPGDACKVPYSNGAPIVQAGYWGRYVGKAEFEIKDGKSTLVSYELIPVNLKNRLKDAQGKTYYEDAATPVVANQEVYDALKVYQDKGDQALKIKVGNLTEELTTSRGELTKLGYLAAEAQRTIAQGDFAIINSGGLRAALPAGDITYRDILVVQPFANTLTTVDLTSKEVVDYLTKVAGIQGGGFPQYAGVTFDYNPETGVVSNVKINNQPLADDKTYKLVVLSFLANGGDNYPVIVNNPTYVDTGYNDAKAFVEYFARNPVVDVAKLPLQGPTLVK